jgi:hypothetical protein
VSADPCKNSGGGSLTSANRWKVLLDGEMGHKREEECVEMIEFGLLMWKT